MLDEDVAAFDSRDSGRRTHSHAMLILEMQWLTTCCCCETLIMRFRLPVPVMFFLEAVNESPLRFIAQIGLHLADPFLPALCLFHLE